MNTHDKIISKVKIKNTSRLYYKNTLNIINLLTLKFD